MPNSKSFKDIHKIGNATYDKILNLQKQAIQTLDLKIPQTLLDSVTVSLDDLKRYFKRTELPGDIITTADYYLVSGKAYAPYTTASRNQQYFKDIQKVYNLSPLKNDRIQAHHINLDRSSKEIKDLLLLPDNIHCFVHQLLRLEENIEIVEFFLAHPHAKSAQFQGVGSAFVPSICYNNLNSTFQENTSSEKQTVVADAFSNSQLPPHQLHCSIHTIEQNPVVHDQISCYNPADKMSELSSLSKFTDPKMEDTISSTLQLQSQQPSSLDQDIYNPIMPLNDGTITDRKIESLQMPPLSQEKSKQIHQSLTKAIEAFDAGMSFLVDTKLQSSVEGPLSISAELKGEAEKNPEFYHEVLEQLKEEEHPSKPLTRISISTKVKTQPGVLLPKKLAIIWQNLYNEKNNFTTIDSTLNTRVGHTTKHPKHITKIAPNKKQRHCCYFHKG